MPRRNCKKRTGSISFREKEEKRKREFDEEEIKLKEDSSFVDDKRRREERGKEKIIEGNDDFVMNDSENKSQQRGRKKEYRSLISRASVRPLYEVMRCLTAQRKKVIKDMGFGALIDFPIFDIPSKLAFFVVDILDTTSMLLKCPSGDILLTPKTVNQIFGLPMGNRNLQREGERQYGDPFIKKWKSQFKNVNMVTIKELSDVILETKNDDYMFRMNVLTLISNTLGSCDVSSTIKFTVLKNVFEGDDVNDINWCEHILDCASLSKLAWESRLNHRKSVVYYGPAMFLMVIYEH